MLRFSVKNQIISREDCFDVVADSKGYLKANFIFSEEWTGDIVAVFGGAEKSFYDVVLENGECLVPWEVIKSPFFTVSVFCGDLITTNAEKIKVMPSGYANGQPRKEPTPDVYNQILSMARTPFIGENGNWYEWNAEQGKFVDSGRQAEGTKPQKGTDYWTEADKAEIVNYVLEAIPSAEEVSF